MRQRNRIFAALAAACVMLALAAAPATAQQNSFEETLRAAEQGDAEAQGNLGFIYHRTRPKTAKPNGARREQQRTGMYTTARFQNTKPNGTRAANRYNNGDGVSQNYAKAIKWYRAAAEQGIAKAQYNLGVMYANGDGVTQNTAEAVKWWRAAAEQGHAKAQYNLGIMYAKGTVSQKTTQKQ
ncbi:MAG: tetratricopeptide repeat protein [Rhodospirillales bacterium]